MDIAWFSWLVNTTKPNFHIHYSLLHLHVHSFRLWIQICIPFFLTIKSFMCMDLRGDKCRQELGTGAHAAMIDQRAFKMPKFYIVCWSRDIDRGIKLLYQMIKTLIWSFLTGMTEKSYTLLNTCPRIFQKLLDKKGAGTSSVTNVVSRSSSKWNQYGKTGT